MNAEFDNLLRQAGCSVQDAADLLGYSESHIYRWKRGEEIPREGVIRLLNSEIEKNKVNEGNGFSFIDLFAGIGGLRQH